MNASLDRFGRITLIALFFAWGCLSVMVDMTIPHFKSTFALGYRDVMLLQSAFFMAYLFLAIPAGMIAARIGFRITILTGLGMMAAGALLLALASRIGSFPVLLPATFTMASGICFLQVSANPLAAAMGGSRSAASNLTFAQAFNALGTVLGPLIAAQTFLGAGSSVEQTSAASVTSLFVAMAACILSLAVIAAWKLRATPQAAATSSGGHALLDAFAKRRLAAGVLAIFVHIGAVTCVASVLVNFLESPAGLGVSRQHAAQLVAVYWGGALLGRFAGAAWLTRIRSGRALAIVTGLAAVLCLLGAGGGSMVASIAVLLTGICNAIQFPTIFSLASSDLEPSARARAAGWLCMGIVGGAVIPLGFGALADATSLSAALVIPAACYLYICWFGLTFGEPAIAKFSGSRSG